MLCYGFSEVHGLPRGQKMGLKNHGLVAIKKDAVFDVPADGAGEDDFLEVAAFADEIFDGVAVRDADHVLLDDGAVVEDLSDVVAGCTDQLYPAFEGSVIWAGADEGGKKSEWWMLMMRCG